MPGEQFGSKTIDGLYADNGVQIGLDINGIIGYGFGLGLKIDYNYFSFDRDAFMKHTQPQTMRVTRHGFRSTKTAINFLFNAPILVGSDDFVINFFGEGHAGLRSMSIPEFDLTYSEITNNFTEVSYRSRSNLMGFLGYNAGLQLLFNNKIGVSFAYGAVLPSRHSIKYSARKFDASGNLYEDESYLHDFLDHTGVKIGFVILFGSKKDIEPATN